MIDQAASILAIVALAAIAGIINVDQQAVDNERTGVSGRPADGLAADTARGETLIAGYSGAPFTYRSDLDFNNPAEKTAMTVRKVGWDGKPFKSPVYYGVRVARWLPGNRTGMMVDFTHSKTITRPEEEVAFEGLLKGATAPAKAKISEMFKHLEFSHGHNMLTINGLWRLGTLMPRLSPYVGVGGGAALPHTEVEMAGEPHRTYEYQYAGPVAQALVGLEVRLPSASLIFDYKVSFADYRVPLSRLEGGILFTDLFRQAQLWWSGVPPPGGYLSTTLASHQIIGGAGVRF